MALDIQKVESILREHWQIPRDLSPRELREHAERIKVLVNQKYSHDNLKYQLRLIQTTKLKQNFVEPACDQIASELLQAANT
ncbi:MAG: hypothetical protein WBX25_06515 [Rhodomicrobium sp.]